MITKILPWLIALVYLVSPYDLLPDFLVGPGWLDDLGVLALAWWWATRFKRVYQTQKGPWAQNRSRQGASSNGGGQAQEAPYEDMDPHEILGVEKGASKEDIKAAYLKLAAQYHPDKVQHLGKEFQELAHKKFIAIQKAYDVLMK